MGMASLKWLNYLCPNLIANNPCSCSFSVADKHRNCGRKPRIKSKSHHNTGEHSLLRSVEPNRGLVGKWGRHVHQKYAECLVGSIQRPPPPSPLWMGGAMPSRVPPWYPSAPGKQMSILLQCWTRITSFDWHIFHCYCLNIDCYIRSCATLCFHL